MPMSVVQLGPVTFSSGATTVGLAGKVDDASNIALVANTATTTPVQIQIELTDTGTNFFTLTIPSAITSSGAATSPIIVTSSGLTVISNIAWTQMRFISTGAVNSGTSISVAKQILV